MKHVKPYLTVRYYNLEPQTIYKIVSDDRCRWYEAYKYIYNNGQLEWKLFCYADNFKEVYDFVQEELLCPIE